MVAPLQAICVCETKATGMEQRPLIKSNVAVRQIAKRPTSALRVAGVVLPTYKRVLAVSNVVCGLVVTRRSTELLECHPFLLMALPSHFRSPV